MLTAEYDGRCRAHDAEERPVNRICFRQGTHDCRLRSATNDENPNESDADVRQRLGRRSDAKGVGRLTRRRVQHGRLGSESRARGK